MTEEEVSDETSKLLAFAKEQGLGDQFIVRSAFNDEDLDGYSAAGLYHSNYVYNIENDFLAAIYTVAQSKTFSKAAAAHKKHGINPDEVKPTVIIQDYIKADYTFTIYTKYNGKVFIEMSSPYNPRYNVDPYVFTYDTETDKLVMESIEHEGRTISFDEDLNIIGADPINDPISRNWETYEPILKKVARNALAVEKEFGKPQDIEGGFSLEWSDSETRPNEDGRIYFWQTRNIVNTSPNPLNL